MTIAEASSLRRGRIIAHQEQREIPWRLMVLLTILGSAIAVLALLRTSNASEDRATPTLLSLADFESRLSRQASIEASMIDSEPVTHQQNIKPKIGTKVRTVSIKPSSHSAVIKPSQKVKIATPSPFHVTKKVQEIINNHGKSGVDAAALARKIVNESAKQNFDPLFVAAVIKSESAFNKIAESHVGAKGLMQIMPATSKFIEGLDDFEPIMNGKLTDPNYNVRLGIRYLKHLDELYKGNRVFVLTAYNWGPGRMVDAFNGKRRIPPEVMNYALKILGDHQKWRQEVYSEITSEPQSL